MEGISWGLEDGLKVLSIGHLFRTMLHPRRRLVLFRMTRWSVFVHWGIGAASARLDVLMLRAVLITVKKNSLVLAGPLEREERPIRPELDRCQEPIISAIYDPGPIVICVNDITNADSWLAYLLGAK